MLYTNTGGHSYIPAAFRELHSDKIIQMMMLQKLFLICNFHVFLETENTNMNRNNIKVYMKVFKEIYDKHNGAEEFINDRIEEICSHEKLSAEEVIYFLVSFFF